MEQATALVTDRFGGTRIATNLRALLASRHGNAVRGAVVIIGSDGWDSDPPEAIAAAMARLQRRAHRVVWMNPRAGAPGFAPTVSTMAAALPYCAELLPADTFAVAGRGGPGGQLQIVTWMDGRNRPTVTPEPRSIACIARGVATKRASSAATGERSGRPA